MAKEKRTASRPQTVEVLPKINEDIAPKTNEGYLDKWGREKPDPTPMAPPVGFVRQPPLHERLRDMILAERRTLDEAAYVETWEEQNDFDVGDDLDPTSPWETNFEVPMGAEELTKDISQAVAAKGGEQGGGSPPADPPNGGVDNAPEPAKK